MLRKNGWLLATGAAALGVGYYLTTTKSSKVKHEAKEKISDANKSVQSGLDNTKQAVKAAEVKAKDKIK